MSSDPASAGSDYVHEEVHQEPPTPDTSSIEAASDARVDSTQTTRTEPLSLWERVLEQTPTETSIASSSMLDQLLAIDDPLESLRFLFGDLKAIEAKEMSLQLGQLNSEIDEILNDQVNAIIHHPTFQKLEASWRGLEYLVDRVEAEGTESVKIRVLDMSWGELKKDLERASDFDQSQMFKKVYEDEFGTPGGQPYSMLIGDYEIGKHPEDLDTLQRVSGVAAAAFCPFITSAGPSMFGLNHFTGLEHVENLERGFDGAEFTKWRSFRESDDARFVGLALPRILMRRPWAHDVNRADEFNFAESTAARDRSKYLWGNAAYAFGEVVIRAFAQSGWLAEIRGVKRDHEWGGLVTGLPVDDFGTDRRGVAPKTSVDVTISDSQESSLTSLGFLPLSHCWDTEFAAFYSSQSTQKPRKYDRLVATQNSKISSMLHYMLCVSRFAHYIKVLARDKVGSHLTPEDCQKELDRWIKQYVTPDDHASQEAKARRPLRGAEVELFRDPSQPGVYRCTLHLWPHYQLDDLTASVRLKTTIKPPVTGGETGR